MQLQKQNVLAAVNSLEELFVYKKIGALNGNMISVVQVENRTLDFHVHEHSDELFYVIEGKFTLQTEEQDIEIQTGEFIIVPKNIKHRPVVNEKTKFLMIEMEGALNSGNSGKNYKQV